jgi:hypothetical protein
MTEYPSETADALGFAPIGLDMPYGIIVQNNPVNKIDPLGLIWVTTGYNYPATTNYLQYLWNRFWQGFDKEINEDNLSDLNREVNQEWRHDPNNPCRDKEYPIGTRRTIPQTYTQYPNPGPDEALTNNPEADYYHQWNPWVDNPTYNNYPNMRGLSFWGQGH